LIRECEPAHYTPNQVEPKRTRTISRRSDRRRWTSAANASRGTSVCPTSRGKGTHLFADRQDLKPIEATLFENGIVLLRYEIKK
jgi:hypothetical protein